VSMVGINKDVNVEFGRKWFRKAWVNVFGEARVLMPKIFLDCHSFEVSGDDGRTWVDEAATLGVFSEVTHELASKLWLMLARCDGESTERTDGMVDIEATSNDQPLADANDVLMLFVFCVRAEGCMWSSHHRRCRE